MDARNTKSAFEDKTVITSQEFIDIILGKHKEYINEFDSITVRNSTIVDAVEIIEDFSFTHSINIEGCTFNEWLYIGSGIFKEYITIKDCTFEKSIMLIDGTFESSLQITQNKVKGQFQLSNGSYKNIDLSFYSIDKISIRGGNFDTLDIGQYLGSKEYNKIIIFNSYKKLKGNIHIRNIDINEFYLSGYSSENEIILENIKFGIFTLRNFNNTSPFTLINIAAISNKDTSTYFKILNSNIGKANFNRVNFKDFTEVIIKDSFISDSVILNSSWKNNFTALDGPSSNSFDKDNKKQEIIEVGQNKETFRQLKYIYQKQGDKINESYFYSLEMKAHNKLLRYTHPFDDEFWDKTILVLSNYLTRFGQSFIIPLLWLLLINILLFCIMIIFFNYKGLTIVSINESSFRDISYAIGEYIRFLNPLHKSDDITGWAVLWDTVSRIFSSYLIYSLIRVSRRFLS